MTGYTYNLEDLVVRFPFQVRHPNYDVSQAKDLFRTQAYESQLEIMRMARVICVTQSKHIDILNDTDHQVLQWQGECPH